MALHPSLWQFFPVFPSFFSLPCPKPVFPRKNPSLVSSHLTLVQSKPIGGCLKGGQLPPSLPPTHPLILLLLILFIVIYLFINILRTFNITIVECYQTLLTYFVHIVLLFYLNSDDCKLIKLLLLLILLLTKHGSYLILQE